MKEEQRSRLNAMLECENDLIEAIEATKHPRGFDEISDAMGPITTELLGLIAEDDAEFDMLQEQIRRAGRVVVPEGWWDGWRAGMAQATADQPTNDTYLQDDGDLSGQRYRFVLDVVVDPTGDFDPATTKLWDALAETLSTGGLEILDGGIEERTDEEPTFDHEERWT